MNPAGTGTDGRKDLLAAAVLFGACAAGYGALTWFFHVVSPDGFIYLDLAENIPAAGYVVLGEPHNKFLPLYPYLMAGFNLATGGALGVEKWGQIISVLSGAGLAPVLFLAARRLGASRSASLIAAIAQALMAVGWDQYRDVNVMPIFTLLIFLAYWQVSAERFFLAGVLIGLGIITRYEGLLLAAALVAAHPAKGRALARSIAGMAIAASPWIIHNLWLYGRVFKTSYFKELGGHEWHAAEMALDLVKDFGPVALAAAAAGMGRLPRRWLVLLGGFALLYIGLHLVWWWYQDRFLLALMPAVFIPAALGLDRIAAWWESRGARRARRMRPALAAGVLAPLMVISGLYLYGLITLPQDPLLDAAMSVRDYPGRDAVLGGNLLLLKHTTGRPAFSWGGIRDDEGPDAYVLKQVLTHDVGIIIWLNVSPVDWLRFNYLKSGENRMVQVDAPGGRFALTYLFINSFSRGNRIVMVYRVSAARAG